jgi:tetratricopeptide (TPR) repeat protein
MIQRPPLLLAVLLCRLVSARFAAGEDVQLEALMRSNRLLLGERFQVAVKLRNTGTKPLKVIVPHRADITERYLRGGKLQTWFGVSLDPFPRPEHIVLLPQGRTVTGHLIMGGMRRKGPTLPEQAGHYVIKIIYDTLHSGDLDDPAVAKAELTYSVEADFLVPQGRLNKAYQIYLDCWRQRPLKSAPVEELVDEYPDTSYAIEMAEELANEYLARRQYDKTITLLERVPLEKRTETIRCDLAESYASMGNEEAAMKSAEGLSERLKKDIRALVEKRQEEKQRAGSPPNMKKPESAK